MSLGDVLFASGFDSQDTGIFDISNSGTFLTSANRTSLSTAHHRGNPQSFASFRSGSTGAVAPVSEFVVGCGIYTAVGSQNDYLVFWSPNGTTNVQLGLDNAGHIYVRRGSTVLATGATVLTASTWYWIWAYFKINDTTGIVRVKLNGVTEIATTTGLDTRGDAVAGGDTCDRVGGPSSTDWHLDDLYVQDATATTNNGDDIDIGEVTIPYIVPDSAGDTTGMTRGGADSGANWSQVEEKPPNDATDYVEHATSGTLDLYNLGTVSGMASVKGVAVRNRVQKDAAGAKTFRSLLKSGGTVSNGPDLALGTSWQTFVRNLRKNPVTAVDFTTTEIDALQVGQEVRT